MELANLQVASVKPARSESGLSVQSVGGGADRKKTPFNELLNTKVDLSRKPNAVAGSKVDLIEERKGNDAGNGLKKPLKEKPTKKQAETSLSNQTSAKGEEETKAKKKASDFDLQRFTMELIADSKQERVTKAGTSILDARKGVANVRSKTHSVTKASTVIQRESKGGKPQQGVAKVQSNTYSVTKASTAIQREPKSRNPQHSGKIASIYSNQNERINTSLSDKTNRNRIKSEVKGGVNIPVSKRRLEKAEQKLSNQKPTQANNSLAVQLHGDTSRALKDVQFFGDVAPVESRIVGSSGPVSLPDEGAVRSARIEVPPLVGSKLEHPSPAKRANLSQFNADSNQHSAKREKLTEVTRGEAKLERNVKNGEFVNTYGEQRLPGKAQGGGLSSKEASFAKGSSKGQDGGASWRITQESDERDLVRTTKSASIAVDRSRAKTVRTNAGATDSTTSTTTNFKLVKPASAERFGAVSDLAMADSKDRSRLDGNQLEQKLARSAVTLKSIRSLSEVNNRMQLRETVLSAPELLNQSVPKVRAVTVSPRSRFVKKEGRAGKGVARADKMSRLGRSLKQVKEQQIRTLGQGGIKAENAGTKAAFLGAEMKLDSGEEQLNGNPRQQLPNAGLFASRPEGKAHISLAAQMVEAGRSDLNHIKDISVRTDLANRLNQMEVDLKSIQAKVVQPKTQTTATAAVYREIMSVTESFRGMSNGRWAMTIEPLESVSIKLDLRMMDSQLVVQARLDRGNQAVLANGWSELQALLAEKEIDLKSLTVGNQNENHNSFKGGRDERQPGESGTDEDSWFTEELGEMMAEFEKEVQKPRMAQRTARKSRTADATFESWA